MRLRDLDARFLAHVEGTTSRTADGIHGAQAVLFRRSDHSRPRRMTMRQQEQNDEGKTEKALPAVANQQQEPGPKGEGPMHRATLYVADVLESTLNLLCAMMGHAFGCWILNRSPVGRLYAWAVVTRTDDPASPNHAECQWCHFDRTGYVPFDRYSDAIERAYEDGIGDGKRIRDVELGRSWTASSAGAAGTTVTVWPPQEGAA